MYAKIDSQGAVLEFPYFFEETSTVPNDAVEVDTVTLKPNVKWDEALFYDTVTKTGDIYQLSYTVTNKYSAFEEKQKAVANLKRLYENENEKRFTGLASQLKAGYTDDEVMSWDTQVKEANDYLAGVDMTGSLIEIMATKRGLAINDLATRILTKREAFTTAYGNIIGIFHKNADILAGIDLNDYTTFDLIDQYGWDL